MCSELGGEISISLRPIRPNLSIVFAIELSFGLIKLLVKLATRLVLGLGLGVSLGLGIIAFGPL